MAIKQPNYAPALSEWAKLWQAPGLPGRVSISFSPRLRRSLGRTRPQSGVVTLHAGLASAHLFVRHAKMISGRSTPFVYCGQVTFEKWQGERPISIRKYSISTDDSMRRPQVGCGLL